MRNMCTTMRQIFEKKKNNKKEGYKKFKLQ